jgi:hypothetical protein
MPGVAFHDRRDHERMEALVFIGDMLVEQGGGGFFGGQRHGEGLKRT